ncbi:hypothetical protein Ahy_B07g088349 [Arachis hypogaea]|uniref:SHSP domain-containing protein n=1 Tax=Arachis hypogaea TaxID=3818 RepID=A0A444YE84_ARAHY|nr:hypothetical protein Ahy_B07g088349 [Arachis hypogaea]
MAMNQGNAQLEYQDIEPPYDWDHKKESDTLIVSLPGFKREQLRVQVTSTRLIRMEKSEDEGERSKLGLGLEKRLSTVSRQGEEYRNAVYGLVEELKKQKKIANLVVVMFLVVLLVLYVNNAIKSSFGGAGPKIQEL